MERWKWDCWKLSTRLRVTSPPPCISFHLRTGTPRPRPTSCQLTEEVPSSSRMYSPKRIAEEIKNLGTLTSAQAKRMVAVAMLIPARSFVYFLSSLTVADANYFTTGIFRPTCTTWPVRSPNHLIPFFSQLVGRLPLALSCPFVLSCSFCLLLSRTGIHICAARFFYYNIICNCVLFSSFFTC